MPKEEGESGDKLTERLDAFYHTNFETPHHSRLVQYAMFPFTEIAQMLTSTTVSGTLPESGPALWVMNHKNGRDVFIAHWLGITRAKRTVSLVTKRTVIDPAAPESNEAIERRKLLEPNLKLYAELNPLGKLREQALAAFFRKFNPIPIDIGEESAKQLPFRLMQEFRENRMVGIFYQGTRKHRFDLIDDQPGVAIMLAKNFPRSGIDIPVYPIGISGSNKLFGPIDVRIGKPFYHSDVPRVEGLSSIESARRFVRDRVAEVVVDPKLKPAWRLNQFGLTREQIETLHTKNPDLDLAASLLEASQPESPEKAWQLLISR